MASVSGFPVQERCGHAGVSPAKGHHMRWYGKDGARLLAVQWTGLQKGAVDRTTTRCKGHKLE